MQMLTDDDELSRTGEALLTEITGVHTTDSRSEFDKRRTRTRDGISQLVRAAKDRL
ncbi:hypothetical protein ACWCXB_18270 [Streptomyces sp. NPDC001514]